MTLEDGGGGGGGGVVDCSSPVKNRGRGGKFGSRKDNNSSPRPQPPIQQRLHTKTVDGKEGILCAAEAICECGRRAGGGTGSGKGEAGGEKGSKVKLPLAVLKVWGRDSSDEEGRRRNNRPSAHGKLGAPCRGRRLRVVSPTTPGSVFYPRRAARRADPTTFRAYGLQYVSTVVWYSVNTPAVVRIGQLSNILLVCTKTKVQN